MEPGGYVKMRGVTVGRVGDVQVSDDQVLLQLKLEPGEIRNIPANVAAQIRASTAFGAKFVDLQPPKHPSSQAIAAHAVLRSSDVTVEVNTVFENLTAVLHKIPPAKLNGVLTALADGLRGKGPTMGEATTAANRVLAELNPRADALQRDWRALREFSDTYDVAMPDILRVLDSASTTSQSITSNAHALDEMLLSVVNLSRSGVELLAPSKDDLVAGINALEPTTGLLFKYDPQLTCMLTGAKKLLDPQSEGGFGEADRDGGANGKSTILDVALLMGDDPYRYPDNLPIVGAKGGPGGKPGCGSLPDVSENFPQRYLVTDTGWGTGLDVRPNPGIAFPGWANYFPVTRGVPEPPSLRNTAGGPAIGPVPYPGAPPHGAQHYAPDGTPLYPGLPPAPPPGSLPDPGARPGLEPYLVPNPMAMPPTPGPPPPTPAPLPR
jgi:phospholipid/cholesterol/gamma-HCH transport system substrate-binding protein